MNRATILLCNTLFLLLLAEGAARIAEAVHPSDSDMVFDYAPYRMLRAVKAPWALNREGFRAKELETYRGRFLVEFLGDSVCLGVGTNPGQNVPDRLEETLHRAGMNDAVVLNLCQGGASSGQTLAIFLEYGLPLSPQVVLSFNGANDLMHPKPVGEDEAANLPYRNREMAAQFDGRHGVLAHLALSRVAGRLARRGRAAPFRGEQAVPVQSVLNAYLYSTEVVRTLTKAQGGLYAVLLQPTLHYQKPWSEEEGRTWHTQRPADGDAVTGYVRDLYGAASTALARWSSETGGQLFDLTGVFAQTSDTVYSDAVHFTGNRGYAMLAAELERQGLVEQIAARYRLWEEGKRADTQRSSLWPH